MLEMLLMQYADQFGCPFPLKSFEGKSEIEVINVIYDCLQTCEPYDPGKTYWQTIEQNRG